MGKLTRKILYVSGLIIVLVVTVYLILELNNIKFVESVFFKAVTDFFNFVFSINIILIAIFIFLENRNPSRTIAWLLVLFLIPWLGFILYIVFGRNTFKKKKIKSKQIKDRVRMKQSVTISDQLNSIDNVDKDNAHLNNRLPKLLLHNANAYFTKNNEVTVLTNGETTFEAIFDEIDKATKYIHLEYYIIKEDEIGTKIKNLLIRKVNEGVKVRIIYDAVGCWKLSKQYIADMKEAGVEMFPFFPVMFPILSEELNYRNHRKIIIIDGSVGFVGGLNIGDEYLGKSPKFGFWRDTHLRIKGMGVKSLHNIFLNDWSYASQQIIDDAIDLYPIDRHYGNHAMQIVASGPDSDWFTILQAYFKMINSAEKRIWITTPYLVPGDGVMLALKTAALSGVDVRIIIPDKADHFLVYWASQDNIEELLEAGVKVFRYKKGFIHSKIMLVDGLCASVGTANLDIRSLEINFEVNAFIYDAGLVSRLEEDFNLDIRDSEEIELEIFKTRKWYFKFLEAFGRLVSPLQ